MATILSVGDHVQLRVWTVMGQQAAVCSINVFVFTATANPTDQDLCEGLDSIIAADAKALLANGAQYRGVQSYIISRNPLPAFASYNGSNGAGVAGAIAAPGQVSGIVKTQTAFAGRKFRGRIYWPFPATVDIAATGIPTTSYQIRLNTLATALFTGFSYTIGGRTVAVTNEIWHRATKTSTPITAFSVESAFATQKRRGSFGRANTSPI